MKNKYFLILISIPLLALLLWFAKIELQYMNAPRVKVAVGGYDPRDLLSGHYLNLRTLWDETDCTQFVDNTCPTERFNFNYRFYLYENDAKFLDKVIRNGSSNMKLEFSFPKEGAPLIRNLYIDNKDWKSWVNEYKEKP